MIAPRLLIISAEASSTLYAQRLLQYWKKNNQDVDAFGVGSKAMEEIGFKRFGQSEKMAVVGAAEIIEHYSAIKKVFNDILDEVDKNPPKVAVLLDYPEFNLRLAKQLKKRNIPVIYYISPQIWAWRKGRVSQLRDYCDKVLLLFPFEVDFYSKHDVPYEFVGHPLIDELENEFLTESWILNERKKLGIQDHEITLGLMPGSRKGELDRHFAVELEVARRLMKKHENLKILILCAPSFEKNDFLPYLEHTKFNYLILKNDPFKMIAMTDVILAASGTATLMVGLLEKPMVIIYRLKWLTSLVAKIFVRGVRFFGITNLILGKEVSPERFQEKANPDELEKLINSLITDSKVYESQKVQLSSLRSKLGNSGVTERVAKIINTYLQI